MAPRSAPDTTTPTSLPGGPDLSQLTPRPGPRRPSSGPMFLPADPTQSPSMTATSLPDASPREASPSAGDEPRDEMPKQSDAPRTSSKGSSAPDPKGEKILAEGFTNLVIGFGSMAHDNLVRDELAEEAGQYLLESEEEAAAIAAPLASIAQRHGGIGAGADSDFSDAVMALIGLAIYGLRQLRIRGEIRKARRTRARAATHDVDGGDQS